PDLLRRSRSPASSGLPMPAATRLRFPPPRRPRARPGTRVRARLWGRTFAPSESAAPPGEGTSWPPAPAAAEELVVFGEFWPPKVSDCDHSSPAAASAPAAAAAGKPSSRPPQGANSQEATSSGTTDEFLNGSLPTIGQNRVAADRWWSQAWWKAVMSEDPVSSLG